MSVDLAEPFATALRYATAPYAQGVATQALTLGRAAAGVSAVAPYDFSAFQSRYSVQSAALDVSYVLTLGADQTGSPALVTIGWSGALGEGASKLLVPAGALAGESFGLPGLPSDPSLVLTSLTEAPPPANGVPSGPDKWSLTALMGNGARLLWALTGEAQTVAATARDVAAQSHIATARGGSLDHIGAGLGVPRLLAAPYRLDYDTGTIALYHLDDLTAPVLDAAHDNPGVSVGATRGVAGKFGEAAQITPSGAITIPDAVAFAIDPAVGFTVEMFANLAAAPAATDTVAFAQKRPRFGQSDSPGWALALEPAGAGHALAFTLTDSAGVVVRATAAATLPVGSWFHVAGVIDPTAGQARVLLNGATVALAPLDTLGLVDTGADLGLGGDSFGASHLNGALDEVRFSSVARTDFSNVLGASPEPYGVDAATIALYHLDETAEWIDEDRGVHYAQNRGSDARREGKVRGGPGVPGRRAASPALSLGAGLPAEALGRRLEPERGRRRSTTGPYPRFGYRQGAISEPGLDGALHPVLLNDGSPEPHAGPGDDRLLRLCAARSGHCRDPGQHHRRLRGLRAGRRRRRSTTSASGSACRPASLPPPTRRTTSRDLRALYHSERRPDVGADPGFARVRVQRARQLHGRGLHQGRGRRRGLRRAVIASRSQGLRIGEPLGSGNRLGADARPLPFDPRQPALERRRRRRHDGDRRRNVSLADGAFHHVAGVVDRDLGAALLYVDEVEMGQTPLGSLAAGGAAAPITVGNSPALTAPYAGLIDEVRISSGARRSFAPVLGESDDRYRQRLAIFKPWRLPNVPTIRGGVQALTLNDPTQADVTGLLLARAIRRLGSCSSTSTTPTARGSAPRAGSRDPADAGGRPEHRGGRHARAVLSRRPAARRWRRPRRSSSRRPTAPNFRFGGIEPRVCWLSRPRGCSNASPRVWRRSRRPRR